MQKVGLEEAPAVISFLDLKAQWGTFWGGEAKGNRPNRYNRLSAKLGELSAAGSEDSVPIDLTQREQRLAENAIRFANTHSYLLAEQIVTVDIDENRAIKQGRQGGSVRSYGEIATAARAQVAPLVNTAATLAAEL